MVLFDINVWKMIVGLALMLVGGLMLWSYGMQKRLDRNSMPTMSGPEAEATRDFHTRLVTWFFWYGMGCVLVGLALVAWGRLGGSS